MATFGYGFYYGQPYGAVYSPSVINPDSVIHALSSDNIDVVAHYTIEVHNSTHKVISELDRIINWAFYSRYFGNYAERSPETGNYK